MLQRARRVPGHALADLSLELLLELRLKLRQDLAQVLAQRRYPFCLVGIRRIGRQRVAVILDGHATAGRGQHDRLGPGFDQRPPGIDVVAHVGQCAVLIIQMKTDRATATGLRRDDQLHVERIEYARSGSVDVGRHRRLHAAIEQQHLAGVFAARPAA